MNRRVLLAIRPRFAEAILNGTKTYELRRRFPELDPGTIVYLYSSSPQMAIVGSFICGEIMRAEKAKLWAGLKEVLSLDADEYMTYLGDQSEGVALHTTRPIRFQTPIPLVQIRSAMRIDAPQSFRYLPAHATEWLDSVLMSPPRLEVVERQSLVVRFA